MLESRDSGVATGGRFIRAISLWEPWASLMRCGAKTIETRSWAAPRQYWGQPLLICGSKRWSRDQELCLRDPRVRRALRGAGPDDLCMGRAAAIVDLVECRSTNDPAPCGVSEDELAFGDFSADRFGWRTANLRADFEPFPVTGRQGLFRVQLPAGFCDGSRRAGVPDPAGRSMTELERRACLAIAPWVIRYPRGTSDLAAARSFASAAERPEPRITDEQARRLWDHVRRYRERVFDAEVVAEAERSS